MIYALFLCSYIASRPELGACNRIGINLFSSPEGCKAELMHTRLAYPDMEFKNKLLRNLHTRQELVCKHMQAGWE